MDWTDFFLEIEPYSMRRVDPVVQAQRAQLMQELVIQLAPLIPQMPYINWPALLDMVGEANNLPDLAKILLNPLGLQMAQSQVMPGQLPGLEPMSGLGLPPGMNPNLAMGVQGGPVRAVQPQKVLRPGQMAAHEWTPVPNSPAAGQP